MYVFVADFHSVQLTLLKFFVEIFSLTNLLHYQCHLTNYNCEIFPIIICFVFVLSRNLSEKNETAWKKKNSRKGLHLCPSSNRLKTYCTPHLNCKAPSFPYYFIWDLSPKDSQVFLSLGAFHSNSYSLTTIVIIITLTYWKSGKDKWLNVWLKVMTKSQMSSIRRLT